MSLCLAPSAHQNFSLQQIGTSSARASIASCTSLPPTHVFTTIGIYKMERVAIKKIAKKKVIEQTKSFCVSFFTFSTLFIKIQTFLTQFTNYVLLFAFIALCIFAQQYSYNVKYIFRSISSSFGPHLDHVCWQSLFRSHFRLR